MNINEFQRERLKTIAMNTSVFVWLTHI